jgi:hypothetical protein
LRSALSVRAKDGKVFIVDALVSERPKTKDAIGALKAWGVEGKVLLVLTLADRMTAYAFRNLPEVHVIAEDQLNVYDVMNADAVVFVRAAVEALQSRGKDTDGEPAAPIASAAPVASAPAATVEADATTSPAPATEVTPSSESADVEGAES